MAEAAVGISYIVENDSLFIQTLRDAAEVVSDLRIPFGLISRDFYKSERAIFGLKGPGQYPPFKGEKDKDGLTSYQKRKRKKFGFDYPLLVATGALAASITQSNAKGSINLITPLSLTIGTSIPYGIYHQSDSPRSKVPLRKFVFIGPEAPRFATSDQVGRLDRWTKIIEDFVIKSYIKKGFT